VRLRRVRYPSRRLPGDFDERFGQAGAMHFQVAQARKDPAVGRGGLRDQHVLHAEGVQVEKLVPVLPDPSLVDPEDWKLSQFLEQCEKLLLQNALRQTRGNQSKTARLLGITPRSVYNKLIKHRLRL